MSISVIIPTLNEEQFLPNTIASIRSQAHEPERLEIIVADCDSTDHTLGVARAHKVVVVEQMPGLRSRAEALNLGARYATGDWLLFLHADTIVPLGFDHIIYDTDDAVGGAFEFAFSGNGWGLRLVEKVNRFRYRCSPVFYGDQGIFVRRELFHEVGGYPEIEIMEDAQLCRNLRGHGALELKLDKIYTSPRRFNEGGVLKVFLHDMRLWGRDFLGHRNDMYADDYRLNNENRARKL